MLASRRVNGSRLRAALLLVAGWLLPASASAAHLWHEAGHAHGGAADAVESLLHGHLHSESAPPHSHELATPPDSSCLRPVSASLAATAVARLVPTVPVGPRAVLGAERDDPDPGGPARQASLSVFRI